MTTEPPWKRKQLPLSLFYSLNISHFWPACGYRTNPTQRNTVIIVSINGEEELNVKRILVSLQVSHGWHSLGSTALHKTADTVNSLCCHQCQSTPTTESVRPDPQRASESNQGFDFPLVAECNHRLRHHNMMTPPSPADGPVTAKYHVFHVFPLVLFWLAGLVRLSRFIPHRVSVVGLVLAHPCYVVDNVGMKQIHQHRLKIQTVVL